MIRKISLLPVLDLVGPFNIIDVHADFVVDVGRQVRAVAMGDVGEHNACPELLVFKQTHGFVDQALLVCDWLQFVQVDTLN